MIAYRITLQSVYSKKLKYKSSLGDMGTKLMQPGKRGAGGPDLIKHKKNAPNENFKRCHKPDEVYWQ
jgi:hypothetical protein